MSDARPRPAKRFEPLRRAVTADEIVRALADIGLTDRDIARATGASGAGLPGYDERLRDLGGICLLLSDTLTARGVRQWLNARNRLLENRRPVELIAEGETDRVRLAAASFVEGAVV
jgi:hypothetical protein